MEADSNVHEELLNSSENSRRSADGGSSLYDGTPLVEYSVTRVCMSSRSHKVLTRSVMDVTHREHRSCLCLSTTVLDLSASLKDPRLQNEVPLISACVINVLPFSGCRRISHHLVETLARYLRASLSSCHCPVSQTMTCMTGHRLRGERRSKGRVLSLPQRLFSHCCQSCCTCLSLAHRRRGDPSPSHHDTFS
jgi:hypothetical protein